MTFDLLSLYNFPTWLFCTIIVGAFITFALTGQIIVCRFLPRWFGDKQHNAIVGQFLSASGVFFGITLGLFSVSAWENFSSVEGAVTGEANLLGVLYRFVDNYPEPHRAVLTDLLRDYVRNEIDQAWPQQRLGIVPGPNGNLKLDRFFKNLALVEPSTEAQKILYHEATRAFSSMIESRCRRLARVKTQLPPIIWILVMGGSILTLSLMWLFVVENKHLHNVLTAILASLLGLLVFLIALMDFPFRGKFSVGPDAFELVYEQLMKK
jgi:hypothetical protein